MTFKNKKHLVYLKFLMLIMISILAAMIGGCSNNHLDSSNTSLNSNVSSIKMSSSTRLNSNVQKTSIIKSDNKISFLNDNNAEAIKLARLNYRSGQKAIIQVNNGRSSLKIQNWKRDCIHYSKLDRLNRASNPAIAYLENRNIANDNFMTQQVVKPTGWHQKFNSDDKLILNQGHIIAYSLSKGITDNGNYNSHQKVGNQNNIRNLFTQTAFCNQELQAIYENKISNALRQGAKVIYRVQPIFQRSDLMAKGVWLQAVGSNGLNFNVYLFNVQPGYQFNYMNGIARVNNHMKISLPFDAPHFNKNKKVSS